MLHASGRKVDGRLDRRRLALVVDRFTSSHDGERLAALEAAGRLLAAGNTTWRGLIDGAVQAHDIGEGREPSHRQIAEALLRDAGEMLTPWERSFLIGCIGFARLSDKQQRTLGEIHGKVTVRAGHA